MTDDKRNARRPVTGLQVMKMIGDVDDLFHEWIVDDRVRAIRDFLDCCERETLDGDMLGVYFIGDLGWVSEDEWDGVFSRQPEWARGAYMIEANEGWTGDMDLCEEIATAYNEGGVDALGEWVERIEDDGDLNVVFYTEFWDDELEHDWAEELADLRRKEPEPGSDAAPPSPSPDMTGSGIGI